MGNFQLSQLTDGGLAEIGNSRKCTADNILLAGYGNHSFIFTRTLAVDKRTEIFR